MKEKYVVESSTGWDVFQEFFETAESATRGAIDTWDRYTLWEQETANVHSWKVVEETENYTDMDYYAGMFDSDVLHDSTELAAVMLDATKNGYTEWIENVCYNMDEDERFRLYQGALKFLLKKRA